MTISRRMWTFLPGWVIIFGLFSLVVSVGFAQPKDKDYVKIDKELQQMHDAKIFKGGKVKGSKNNGEGNGKGDPVVLDKESARKQKFSEESIILAEQLAAFTNDLLAPVTEEQPSLVPESLNISKYPEVKAYFEAATERSKQLQTQAIGHTVCGWYFNPKPSVQKNWVRWNSSNPDRTMSSWGYHPGPYGWTRAQTWSPWACGWGTFRDHAFNYSGVAVMEQNYEGWSPRGEPNPEVWRAGPWPYSDWPSYVYWWHQYGPGR